jgi:putative heme iron utilization protein
MNHAMAQALRDLLRGQDIASLGTLHDGDPSVSMVPYALLPGGEFLIHVSDLASHTRDMRAHSSVSLMVVAPPSEGVPPQARARISVQGSARQLDRSAADYAMARATYVHRFPQSEGMFALPDFSLFRVQPRSIRFIAGFAQAVTLTPESFQTVVETRSGS